MSGAVPPLAARPLERAARVPRPVCPGCGRCGRGDPTPAPQRAPLRAGVARCGGGGRASPGGVLSTVARGAWCQALSLPRPPVLWSGQPGFRVPRVPGAVGAGAGIQHRPRSVRPCGPALLAAGVAEGRPRGGGVLSTVVRGAWCQVLSLPWPPVLWSGQPRFRVPRVPGAVGAGVGTQHRPHSVRPCGPALLAVGVAEGRPLGGAFHLCEGRLVSGAVPPPATRPLERAARVPRPACPWCGRCRRGDPSRAPQRAPLRAGVARCEGGGRASPGGVRSTVVRGAWCQALFLPRPPVLWSGQPAFRDPCVPGAVDAGVWTQHPLQRTGGRGRNSARHQAPLTTVERSPPGDALPPPSQRATPARKGARCGALDGSPRLHRPHPGHAGRGTLAARSRGRAAGGGTAPDTRRPSQRWKAPPQGTPFRHTHSEQRRPARAHAVGPVLSPHARTNCTRDTRDAEPRLPAPEDGRPGEGQHLTPCAPHKGGKHPPPRGRPSATPAASNAGPQGRTLRGRCWIPAPGFRDPCVPGAVDAGVWTQHRPHSVRPCGLALLAVGAAEGRPRGGCLPPL